MRQGLLKLSWLQSSERGAAVTVGQYGETSGVVKLSQNYIYIHQVNPKSQSNIIEGMTSSLWVGQ